MRLTGKSFGRGVLTLTGVLLVGLSACSSSSSSASADAGHDTGTTKTDAKTVTDSGEKHDAVADVSHVDVGPEDTGTKAEASVKDSGQDTSIVTVTDSAVDTGIDTGATAHDSGHDSGIDSGSGSTTLDAGTFNCMGDFDCSETGTPAAGTACIIGTCTNTSGSGTCAFSYATAGTACTDHGGTMCDGEGHCK